ATGELLQAAACIGTRFELTTLSLVTGKDRSTLLATLRAAIEEGIIGGDDGRGSFGFSHDRVHKAAYDLMPEGERRWVHLQLARALLEGTPAPERDDRLMEIVTHLNKGWDLI